MEEIIITKKVSKHGEQSVIILPRFLKGIINPKDIVQVQLKVIGRGDSNE